MAKVKRSHHTQKPKKSWLQQYLWLLIIGGILLLVVGFVVYVEFQPQPGREVPSMGNQHIRPPEKSDNYNTTPPTSGPHYGGLAQWGVHTEPIPNELQVHNLEDGGVMVQYNCPDGCEDLVRQLAEIVERYNHGVILAPYPDMDSRIALTAWQRIDTFEEFDETRIENFINAYRGIDHHVR